MNFPISDFSYHRVKMNESTALASAPQARKWDIITSVLDLLRQVPGLTRDNGILDLVIPDGYSFEAGPMIRNRFSPWTVIE